MKLRHLQKSDLSFVHELESDADVVRFTPMREPQNLEQSALRHNKFLKIQEKILPFGFWIAENKSSKPVGWFMFLKTDFEGPELGFMIKKSEWGKGHATFFAQMLLEKFPKETVFARVEPDNLASHKVMKKLGFMKIEEEPEVWIYKHSQTPNPNLPIL